MTIGLVGRKSGMTRVFTEGGASVPVTVVEITPNRVTQIKDSDSDGYRAIQVTTGKRRANKVSRSEAGHFAKAGVAAGYGLWEFRLVDPDEAFEVGAELTVSRFAPGQKVDVAGKSKGRAFRVSSSAGISIRRTPHTVTLWRTGHPALSVSARRRGAFSRAKKCPARWVPKALPSRGLKSCGSTRSVICC